MHVDVGEAQRPRVMDQHPQHAATARQIAYRAVRLLVDAARQEPLEPLAPVVEHSDRGVLRPREFLGDIQ